MIALSMKAKRKMDIKVCRGSEADVSVDNAAMILLYPDEAEATMKFLQVDVQSGVITLELSEHCWSSKEAEAAGIDKYNIDIKSKGQYVLPLE